MEGPWGASRHDPRTPGLVLGSLWWTWTRPCQPPPLPQKCLSWRWRSGGRGSAVGPCRVLGCAPLGGFGSGFPTSLWGVEHTRLCQGPETPGSDAVHPAPQSIRAWSCAASRPAERSPRLRLVPAPSRARTATLCGSSLAAGAGAAGEPSVPWFCGSVVRSALRRRTRSRWAFSPLNPALCLRPGRPRPPQPGAQEPARRCQAAQVPRGRSERFSTSASGPAERVPTLRARPRPSRVRPATPCGRPARCRAPEVPPSARAAVASALRPADQLSRLPRQAGRPVPPVPAPGRPRAATPCRRCRSAGARH